MYKVFLKKINLLVMYNFNSGIFIFELLCLIDYWYIKIFLVIKILFGFWFFYIKFYKWIDVFFISNWIE